LPAARYCASQQPHVAKAWLKRAIEDCALRIRAIISTTRAAASPRPPPKLFADALRHCGMTMRTIELKDHYLSSLLTLIESEPDEYRHLFRGQPNAEWGLVPALYRITKPPGRSGARSIQATCYEVATPL
jgi:hypothetical protein